MNQHDRSISSIPQVFLDEVLARTCMPELVGTQVTLISAANGRVRKAACPFHEDGGESFYVHADGYHCFGCGAHGDAIEFVMRTVSLSFDGAVAMLAAAAGMALPMC